MTTPTTLETLSQKILHTIQNGTSPDDLRALITPPPNFDLHDILPIAAYPPNAPKRPPTLDANVDLLLQRLTYTHTHSPLSHTEHSLAHQHPHASPNGSAPTHTYRKLLQLLYTTHAAHRITFTGSHNTTTTTLHTGLWVQWHQQWIFLGPLHTLIPHQPDRTDELFFAFSEALHSLQNGDQPNLDAFLQRLAIPHPTTWLQRHFSPDLADALSTSYTPPTPSQTTLHNLFPELFPTPHHNTLTPSLLHKLKPLLPRDQPLLSQPLLALLLTATYSYTFTNIQTTHSSTHIKDLQFNTFHDSELPPLLTLHTTPEPSTAWTFIQRTPQARTWADHCIPFGPFTCINGTWRFTGLPQALATHRTTRLFLAKDIDPIIHLNTPHQPTAENLRTVLQHAVNFYKGHPSLLDPFTSPAQPSGNDLYNLLKDSARLQDLFPNFKLPFDHSRKALLQRLDAFHSLDAVSIHTQLFNPDTSNLTLPNLYAQHLDPNQNAVLALAFHSIPYLPPNSPTHGPSLWVFHNNRWSFLGFAISDNPQSDSNPNSLPTHHPLFDPNPNALPKLWDALVHDAHQQAHIGYHLVETLIFQIRHDQNLLSLFRWISDHFAGPGADERRDWIDTHLTPDTLSNDPTPEADHWISQHIFPTLQTLMEHGLISSPSPRRHSILAAVVGPEPDPNRPIHNTFATAHPLLDPNTPLPHDHPLHTTHPNPFHLLVIHDPLLCTPRAVFPCCAFIAGQWHILADIAPPYHDELYKFIQNLRPHATLQDLRNAFPHACFPIQILKTA